MLLAVLLFGLCAVGAFIENRRIELGLPDLLARQLPCPFTH